MPRSLSLSNSPSADEETKSNPTAPISRDNFIAYYPDIHSGTWNPPPSESPSFKVTNGVASSPFLASPTFTAFDSILPAQSFFILDTSGFGQIVAKAK